MTTRSQPASAPMPLTAIPGTDLRVSTYCYGVMRFNPTDRGEADFDLYRRFRDAGGNFFDTAHAYAVWLKNGVGASETGLGDCIHRAGDRERVVVLTKGGLPGMPGIYPRPDDCLTPEVIAADISESLARLRMDYVDIYMLHRDDVRHPVGEIIDTLNAEIARGRVRWLGASNWSTARIAEANAYAAARGLRGFAISSPQWTLGTQNHPSVLPDGSFDRTVVPLDAADVAWHAANRFPVMPWNPSAYGYFADATNGNARSFDSPLNHARRERARALAAKHGCTASQIALAYLTSHDFPVFPVVGTLDAAHLADTLAAAQVRLSAEECRWLRDG